MHKSKRLWLTIYVIHLVSAIGVYGISKGANLSDLSVYIVATVIPLLGYITGETIRPSNK
jgi:hypothetical protein